MKDHMNRLISFLISLLVFPAAPIAVIVAIALLCKPIWNAGPYTPAGDEGKIDLALMMFVVPMLLIILAVLLCATTALTRWVERRYAPGYWWRLLMGFIRLVLASVSLFLFAASAEFFMGGGTSIGRWGVVFAWIASLTVASAFVVQQYRRLVE